MEIRPLHQFKSHELRNLFDQEREVWQHQLYWDYSEPQRVISAMVDAGTLPGFVAMQDGDPVAYTFYVEVSGKGLLGGCFASEWAAPEGVEHQLLEESLAALKRNAALQRVESQFINFREWPIARFFAGKGFSQFDRCFMVRDCQIDHLHRRLVAAEVKQLSLGDLDDMAKLTVDTYASVIAAYRGEQPDPACLRSAFYGVRAGVVQIRHDARYAMIADAMIANGQAGDAAEVVRHVLDTSSDPWGKSEFLRLLAATERSRGCNGKARELLLSAVEEARKSGSIAWTIRAATDLAALPQDDGETRSARAVLATICDRFADEFETRDLRNARSLLVDTLE